MNQEKDILDDENYARGKSSLEKTSPYKEFFKALGFFHSMLSLFLLMAGLVWLYVIFLAYVPGENLLNGSAAQDRITNLVRIDSSKLIAALFMMIYGTACWILLYLLNLIFNMYEMKRSAFWIGIVAMLIDWTIILSSEFDWILD